jgi:hypothetical protein
MSEETALSKKENGRLKKLLKRASAVEDDKALSGIATESDWKEMMELSTKKKAGGVPIKSPGVCFRRGHDIKRVVDASDHRDIFFRLVNASLSDSSTKKRRRDVMEAHPKVPDWASLHNPAAVDQVAVLEVEVDTPEHLQTIQILIESTIEHSKTLSACRVTTRWFPGNQPKSMSSQLMFAQRPKPKREGAATVVVQTLSDLYSEMLRLILTDEELKKEKYPQVSLKSPASESAALPTSLVEAPASDAERRGILSLAMDELSPRQIPHSQAVTLVDEAVASYALAPDGDDNLSPYVMSLPGNDSVRFPQIFAMDCEMVRTTAGMELGRITLIKIVDFSSASTDTEVVFDEIVRPSNRVVDYLTQYSGITPEMLSEDASCVSIEQVQAALLTTIAAEDIVVGHSLENDLQASRWTHSRVIDTSVLFRTDGQSFKHSLRNLAATLLKVTIQTGDHCSEEDALASLQLAVRRAVEGYSFGIHNNRPVNRLSEVEGTVVCVGPSEWISEFVTAQPNSIHALACESIQNPNCKAIAAYLSGTARRAHLAYGHLKVDCESSDDTAHFGSFLRDVLAKVASTTSLMIAVQSGFADADKLSKHKRVRLNPKSTMSWSDADECGRIRAVNACQTGVTYWVSSVDD